MDPDDAMISIAVVGDSMDAGPQSHSVRGLGYGLDGARIIHRHGNEVACVSPMAAHRVDGQFIGIRLEALGLEVETWGRVRPADDRTFAGVSVAVGAAAPADVWLGTGTTQGRQRRGRHGEYQKVPACTHGVAPDVVTAACRRRAWRSPRLRSSTSRGCWSGSATCRPASPSRPPSEPVRG